MRIGPSLVVETYPDGVIATFSCGHHARFAHIPTEQTANTFSCTSFGLYNAINNALVANSSIHAVHKNTEIQFNLQKIVILHRPHPKSG